MAVQHPGVVLDEVLWVAHAACLRCHWFDATGHSMQRPGELQQAIALARRHETSDGVVRDRATRVVTTTSQPGAAQDDS